MEIVALASRVSSASEASSFWPSGLRCCWAVRPPVICRWGRPEGALSAVAAAPRIENSAIAGYRDFIHTLGLAVRALRSAHDTRPTPVSSSRLPCLDRPNAAGELHRGH